MSKPVQRLLSNPTPIQYKLEILNRTLSPRFFVLLGKRTSLNDIIVSFNMLSTSSGMVEEQAKKILEPVLQRVQKKIDLAQRTIAFLQSESQDADPRIVHARAKLETIAPLVQSAREEDIDRICGKLDKCYRMVIGICRKDNNPKTKDVIEEVKERIGQFDMQLLKVKPMIDFNRISSKNSNAEYDGLDDIPACHALAGAAIAKQYLQDNLKFGSNAQNFCFGRDFGHVMFTTIPRGHRETGDYLRTKQTLPQSISIRELIAWDVQSTPHLREVPFSTSFLSRHPEIGPMGLQFAPLQGHEAILEQLDLLKELREEHKLPRMGAVLSLGEQQIPMVIYPGDVISVLDSAGCEESGDKPYQITFGTQKQAAEYLGGLLSRMIKENSTLAKSHATVIAVANKAHFKSGNFPGASLRARACL